MSIFTLTINHGGQSSFGEKRYQERNAISHQLAVAAQSVEDGKSNTGTLVDGDGQSVGTWTYTPVASA